MDSLQFFPALVVGFAASLGFTPLSRQIAMRLGVVDKPNYRKIHHDHKPLMGGLAIYLAFGLAVILFAPPQHIVELGAMLAGASLLAVIGLLDDRYNLSARTRFIAMGIAASGMIAAGVQLDWFHTPLLDYPLTLFWIIAITNALNFLDNMDGLTAGLSAISAGVFLAIALSQGLILVSILAAALLGSAIGFLAYNFNPASTFMGDMGALVLGFVLSILAIKIDYWAQPPSAAWAIPLLALAMPIFDINLVIFTRLAEKRSPLEAGKDHTSHRLMALGLTQRKTLIVMYIGAVFFGGVALALTVASPTLAWVIVGLCAALIGAMYALMISIRRNFQQKPRS
jgi:UDP-GlcNAc:undecaprenyl-phosphate GlcNAc-1-phosphate transferase